MKKGEWKQKLETGEEPARGIRFILGGSWTETEGSSVQVANKARGPNPALHLVLSGSAPCFYLAAAPSSLPLVKE